MQFRLFAVSAAVAAATAVPAGTAHAATVLVVAPGQSVQAAVDAAQPGDTVQLQAGTYHESVTISTDNVTLRGAGAGPGGTLLLPPAVFPDNECAHIPPEPEGPFGGGICVRGARDPQTGQVTRFVRNDRVTNLTVSGFAVNIAGNGSDGLRVDHVTALGGGHYDILNVLSKNGQIDHNTLRGAGHAAVYVGNYGIADSNLLVTNNDIVDGWYGIAVRDSQGVTVTDNTVRASCSGFMGWDDTEFGTYAGGDHITVTHNTFTANNASCESELEGFPEVAGTGVALIGNVGVTVQYNTVTNNRGDEPLSGGIVVVQQNYYLPQVEGNIVVSDNDVHGNSPNDLAWDGNGTGVTFSSNVCTTSAPAGLCS
jgi:parallel beta-helix repeat protein